MSVFIGYPSFMAYQMMKGKKDNNDGFPSIPGTIARYSASGLTNEQMAANPVWVDKTGNGHDLQMKNFFWGGMSGVGGYVQNFNNFKNNATVDKVRIDEQSSNSIKITILTTGISNAIYIPKNIYKFNKSYSIKISSEGYNEGDLSLSFYASSVSTATTVKVPLNPNGITEIPAIKEDDFLAVYINVSGKVGSFTVEQLPLYPGALVFDGVDDYGTCNNFPILTKEKGYTVVALRQYLVEKSTAYLIANGDSISNTSFIFEGNNYKDTWNFGKATGIQASRILATQTSKQYDGVKLNIGTNAEGSNLLQVGKWSKSYSNVAIWELVFLDHDATEEELTKIKDYFVKTYPWLFPDQAWTVTGKTNEDEDRATIANITGNGNDLILSNFGFAEGSGYNEEGEYAGYLVTDGVDDKIVSSAFKMGEDFTVVGEWKMLPVSSYNYAGIVKSNNLYVYNNASIGLTVFIRSGGGVFNKVEGIKSLKAICSDGRVYGEDWTEYKLNTGTADGANTALNLGFNGSNFTKMAFKNLGIYNNQIFSKDDCIKAYNYLQTLKAK